MQTEGAEPPGIYAALIAEMYERGGWPDPDGRLGPIGALRGPWLHVPLLDGSWWPARTADPVAAARRLGRRAALATAERASFDTLVLVRRVSDRRFGELAVWSSVHPRRIVVSGPSLPTVEIARYGPVERPQPADPIGTRQARQLSLTVNSQPGFVWPAQGGRRRSAGDVVAMAWHRPYRLRQTDSAHAEVLRGQTRVARLLRGDPEPDRRYAVGWDPAADGLDRVMAHALASAFQVGAGRTDDAGLVPPVRSAGRTRALRGSWSTAGPNGCRK